MVLIQDISPGQLRRAQSEVALDRARANLDWRRLRPIQRSLSEVRIRRVYSVPDLSVVARRSYAADPASLWLDYRYRPHSYYLGYDFHDDWWYNRPYYPYSSRYVYPYSFRYHYPYWYNPYRPYSRSLWDPTFWRRYHDPYYTRPLYAGYRPYYWDAYDTDRATRLYRAGLINYDALDKYWLSPYHTYRRSDDWREFGIGHSFYSYAKLHYPYTRSLDYPYSYYTRPFTSFAPYSYYL